MNFESTGKDFEKAPAKTHPARLVGIYDIGTQPGGTFEGEKKDDKPQVIFTYELLGKDRQADGTNFLKSEFLTVSLHVKGTLPKRLAALGVKLTQKSKDWYELPKGLNLSVLLGEAVMVEIVHTEAGKDRIGNVMAPIDGMVVGEYTSKLGYLDLDADDYLDKFNQAPEWIQKMCQKATDWESR